MTTKLYKVLQEKTKSPPPPPPPPRRLLIPTMSVTRHDCSGCGGNAPMVVVSSDICMMIYSYHRGLYWMDGYYIIILFYFSHELNG